MPPPVVGIVGVQALRKDFNRLAADERSPLFAAMKRAGLKAVQPIVPLTVNALPYVSGRLAKTVRASGTRSGGSVRIGRKTVPYAGWIEFGGERKDHSSRPYVAGGRYLFPSARGDAERAAQTYSEELAKVFEQSGLWSNDTTDGSAVHE